MNIFKAILIPEHILEVHMSRFDVSPSISGKSHLSQSRMKEVSDYMEGKKSTFMGEGERNFFFRLLKI